MPNSLATTAGCERAPPVSVTSAEIFENVTTHAKILSVDTSEAEKIPGVEIVLTGKNTHMLYGQFISDQPVIAYEKVRYEGEPVAAIAADDPLTARKAADLVKVEYEELPVVNTIEESLKGDILVHVLYNAGNVCILYMIIRQICSR